MDTLQKPRGLDVQVAADQVHRQLLGRIVLRSDYDAVTGYRLRSVDEPPATGTLSELPAGSCAVDACGNVLKEKFGNGLTTERGYDPTDGWILSICTAMGSRCSLAGSRITGSVIVTSTTATHPSSIAPT
ncbi:MAG: hypothetical protein HYV16_14615 [Gammaproteobacteria bacterium]|nr:hypothetical protein [Gammaproteobacteria bacterium]